MRSTSLKLAASIPTPSPSPESGAVFSRWSRTSTRTPTGPVYKVQLGDVVYVLHVFTKKSKSGKATPKADIDLIKSRLKLAKQDHDRRTKAKGKS